MLDFLTHRLDIAVRDAMEVYGKMGIAPDEVGPLFGSVEEVRTFLLTSAPGLFIAAALLSTSANFFLARRVQPRLRSPDVRSQALPGGFPIGWCGRLSGRRPCC
ncbi:MAG: YybS family protein [Candidatus Methylomirabilis sp.]|nr:YybS family protein [Candidatus Methylomirabilis sp.]